MSRTYKDTPMRVRRVRKLKNMKNPNYMAEDVERNLRGWRSRFYSGKEFVWVHREKEFLKGDQVQINEFVKFLESDEKYHFIAAEEQPHKNIYEKPYYIYDGKGNILYQWRDNRKAKTVKVIYEEQVKTRHKGYWADIELSPEDVTEGGFSRNTGRPVWNLPSLTKIESSAQWWYGSTTPIKRRNLVRDELGKARKLYNAGYEADDFDDELKESYAKREPVIYDW